MKVKVKNVKEVVGNYGPQYEVKFTLNNTDKRLWVATDDSAANGLANGCYIEIEERTDKRGYYNLAKVYPNNATNSNGNSPGKEWTREAKAALIEEYAGMWAHAYNKIAKSIQYKGPDVEESIAKGATSVFISLTNTLNE